MIDPICFVNQQYLPLTQASVHLTDLGVQRGYGIFDFLRVINQVPLFIDDHLQRFLHSAQMMRLDPGMDIDTLKKNIFQLIEQNSFSYSGMRILLTGGSSPDGYQVVQPSLAIMQQAMVQPIDTMVVNGMKLVTYEHQRQMPDVKTTDYLMAIWLQPWVKEKGADDVLYCNQGMARELPRSNFFIVTADDTICTPGKQVLEGITRKKIIEIAKEAGYRVMEKDLHLEEIKSAKEVFVSSSTKRLIPVSQLDDTKFERLQELSVTQKLYDLFLQKEKELIKGSSNL